MIYDCFPFWQELDVLEIRLHELGPVVDRFVLVEATRTFSGLPKPLHFQGNRSRFADFLDRIVHVVVDDLASQPDPWESEYHQRNAILRALTCCEPSDVILVSDVDEVPRGRLVAQHAGFPGITNFHQRFYYYYLNCEAGIPCAGTRMLPYRLFLRGLTPQQLRGSTDDAGVVEQDLFDAGWHFSYLGSPQVIREKIAAYSHQDYNCSCYTDLTHIAACMQQGRDLFGREDELQFRFVPIGGSHPRYVREHLERFRHLVRT